jgi:hypothetical protein
VLDNVEKLCESLSEAGNEQDGPADVKIKDELMSLVCLSLYRSKPAGVWINCSRDQFPGVDQIKEAICERFDIEP